MKQDTIQINALDFNPDIDGPNIPRDHNNTVVVSVQDQLTSSEPELSDATNFQEETTDRDPLHTTYIPAKSRSRLLWDTIKEIADSTL